ncbi:metal ABC transporter permease [Nitratidesulfovibrio vulgaris]|uniref:ABC-3 protein n=1 Tax=Nitratidesulfovibrio vulgaris (strain DP4) TaxID=391774 RepID=A0A0H3AC08_NITV4|nr:metal ABC transporter permease [Nitratidesulfovibrio vulgaris]ABM29869.1 ABC-3 protein [Nitratidesulfovibrio vulgaris DP4]GEB81157.1 cation ABC transporter permease [Desulfovibrio desulfuricans]HBW14704.1 metal ABC transporter permease [Desulfovibrio sp.]
MGSSPFDHAFMLHALAAGALAGVACSVAGVFAVLMRLTFIGVCLAHAAFAGGLLALAFGLPSLPAALASSMVAALVVGPLADRGEISPDTAVGIVFSAMIGVAVLCMGLLPGPKTEALNLFWGSILTVRPRDVWLLAAVAGVAVVGVAVFFKEVQAVACHRSVAAAVGIPATAVFYAILLQTGVTVTACLPSVGGLLVYSLLVSPAAAAYQLTYSLGRMFLLAMFFGALSGVGGVLVAWYLDVPAGAAVVLFSCALFLLAAWFSPKRDRAARSASSRR